MSNAATQWPACRARRTLLAALLAVAATLAGCSASPPDALRVPAQAFNQPMQTPLGQAYAAALSASAPFAAAESALHLLVAGPDAFAARAVLAEAAQQALDLQYCIVAQDATATLLMEAALRAAQRGVRFLITEVGL